MILRRELWILGYVENQRDLRMFPMRIDAGMWEGQRILRGLVVPKLACVTQYMTL